MGGSEVHQATLVDNLGSRVNESYSINQYSETWISESTDSSESLDRCSGSVKGLSNEESDPFRGSVVESSHAERTSSNDNWISSSYRHSCVKRLEESIIHNSFWMHVEEVEACFLEVVLEENSAVKEDCSINALLLHIGVDGSSIRERHNLINALNLI